jgi:hypothetical protein
VAQAEEKKRQLEQVRRRVRLMRAI